MTETNENSGSTAAAPDSTAVIAATVAWIERAVIGLELCPFARAAHTGRRIRYVVTEAGEPEALVEVLVAELEWLAAADPAELETTLLIHPHVLTDFLDYNEFLDVADAAVEQLGLTGVVQVASFHPQYQFAGTAANDIDNYTNRSPYPTLHLLREDSVERAVAAHPDTNRIFENNIETLRRLGHDGWNALNITTESKR
ncbi:MAG: DUF1415 domain-containing protein [Betaproteobacteria bacterium]